MGDPRRIGKKYETPNHPWQKVRIEEAKALKKEFGVKNRTEILKMESVLKSFTSQAKNLAIATGKQAEQQRLQLFARLDRLNLLSTEAKLEDVLGLTVRDIMSRRLQTLVAKKGLAKSVKQARQFITHRHIMIGDKVITAPSYLVPAVEEEKITFSAKSTLTNPDHPERAPPEKKVPGGKEEEKEKKGKKEKKEKKEEKKEEKPAEEVKEEPKEEEAK